VSRRKTKLRIAMLLLTLSVLVPKKPAGLLVANELRVADFYFNFCQLFLIVACDISENVARQFVQTFYAQHLREGI
jgi:hypothetical protein